MDFSPSIVGNFLRCHLILINLICMHMYVCMCGCVYIRVYVYVYILDYLWRDLELNLSNSNECQANQMKDPLINVDLCCLNRLKTKDQLF